MTALDEPRRALASPPTRASPLPADALYGRLLASAGAAPARRRARRRARGCGSPTGASSRCRSTAGSRPPTPSTSRSWRASRRRCSTSAAARAATSPRCARRGKRGLGVDLSPVAVRLARGRGADAINGSLWSQVPRAGHVADDPAAGRQHRHRRRARSCCCGAPASCSRPAARSSSRPIRRARRRSGSGSGWRRRASCPSGSAGHGSVWTASPRWRRGRGSRSRRSACSRAARS